MIALVACHPSASSAAAAASNDLAWGAIATAGAATGAAIVAVVAMIVRWKADQAALKQKTEADARAEWWRRAQWAIDRANSTTSVPDSEAGLIALLLLSSSELAGDEEVDLIEEVGLNVLKRVP